MANEADKIKKHQQQIIKEIGNMVTIMGVEAKNHYVKSFRDGGFTDDALVNWQQRKRTERSRRGNRAILVKSGDLRRSVRVVSKSQFSVTLGSDLIYARVHNDGLRAGRGRGFTMPKRQFIGASRQLSVRLYNRFDKRIQSIFK